MQYVKFTHWLCHVRMNNIIFFRFPCDICFMEKQSSFNIPHRSTYHFHWSILFTIFHTLHYDMHMQEYVVHVILFAFLLKPFNRSFWKWKIISLKAKTLLLNEIILFYPNFESILIFFHNMNEPFFAYCFSMTIIFQNRWIIEKSVHCH